MSDSTSKYDLLDLERDLPTTPEDSEALWRSANTTQKNLYLDLNGLLDPFWTLEKAANQPLFCDQDEPFEL